MPILAGSVAAPVEELRHYLDDITGAEFRIESAQSGAVGLFVGMAGDFPWLRFERVDELGPEGFILKSDGKSVYLIAHRPLGVQHAVTTFLHRLGCRWYFPGPEWEIVPRAATLRGSWNERQTPSFSSERRIWYGFGAYPKNRADMDAWERHNRMGGPVEARIGHTWHGLDPKTDFEQHPEWFALTEGDRRPTKPCYSHPDVIRRAVETALAQAADGRKVISMSPPDGLGYCECERCRAVFQGGEPFREHSTLFARRPDGVVVNISSETFFRMVNEVARAVAEKHPGTLVGTYAYSAYSHPPSFDFEPNVFVQTTTAFRRTSLTPEEQLAAFGRRVRHLGIREYYSVFQWDWDYPAVSKGSLFLPKLVDDLQYYCRNGATAINAEASCNWGPRGLGYYLAARLLWDVNAGTKALLGDFYDKAFGPAAGPMERYYIRWHGPFAAAGDRGGTRPAPSGARSDEGAPRDEIDNADDAVQAQFDRESLKAAFADLDEAARRVRDLPGCRERVDHLRMYMHYLLLRLRLEEVAASGSRDAIVGAIKAETVFGARLMNTNMIHARPLIGKAFHRRFRDYMKYLEGMPEGEGPQGWGKGFRQVREDVPSRRELESLWEEDRAMLGL
jgi:hypothetical protein